MTDTSDRNIHAQAIVEPGAQIGKNVTIEPFAVIKKTVILEDDVIIKSHAYIDGYTTIGQGSVIWPGASIGTKPQDLKYQGEKSFVTIGKHCEIREFATINSSCQENSKVQIGDHCLIMAYCHIAHNCSLGKEVVMANGAMLAGYVEIEDFAIVGGMTPVHQFARIGRFAMVGGFSRVAQDIPPFTIGGGYPYRVGGLNLVGLKRRKIPLPTRHLLTKAYFYTYKMGLKLDEALMRIERELEPIPEILHWIKFCRSSKRGLIGMQGITRKCHTEEEDLQAFLE